MSLEEAQRDLQELVKKYGNFDKDKCDLCHVHPFTHKREANVKKKQLYLCNTCCKQWDLIQETDCRNLKETLICGLSIAVVGISIMLLLVLILLNLISAPHETVSSLYLPFMVLVFVSYWAITKVFPKKINDISLERARNRVYREIEHDMYYNDHVNINDYIDTSKNKKHHYKQDKTDYIMQSIYCRKCGKLLLKNSRYCTHCGAKIKE